HVVRHDLVSASQEKWRAFLSGAGNITWAPNAKSFVLAGKEAMVSEEALANDPAADRDCAVVVYNAQHLEVVHRLPAMSGEAKLAAISLGQKRIAVAESDRTIRIWDLSSGDLLHTITAEGVVVKDITYSPDGRFLLAAVGDDL